MLLVPLFFLPRLLFPSLRSANHWNETLHGHLNLYYALNILFQTFLDLYELYFNKNEKFRYSLNLDLLNLEERNYLNLLIYLFVRLGLNDETKGTNHKVYYITCTIFRYY